MDYKKIIGILFILLGLFFIAFPLVSTETVSLIAGICLISFGFTAIFNGFLIWGLNVYVSLIELLSGFLSILLGILFFVNLAALSFLVSYTFYFIAFILIFVGISGIVVQDSSVSKLSSVLILIFGLIMLFLAAFAVANPLFVTILVGICLILRGMVLFTEPDIIEGDVVEG